MQMERQEKMDYAAVVCEYRTNGGGLKMKEWCQQEGYDYFKVRRYSKKEPMFPGLETNAAVSAGTPKPPKLINLIESCRMNHLSPVDYLRHLTDNLMDTKVNKQQLLPCFCKI